MSIEGMWCFVSTDAGDFEITGGGVIILDTQRLYGGDGALAYIGTYSIDSGVVTGIAEAFQFNPAYNGHVDVFGEPIGPSRETKFRVSLNERGFLTGHLIRREKQLPIILKKVRDLP